MKRTTLLFTALSLLAGAGQAQTLEECRRAAERNYPLIRQYDLVAKTTELTLSNVAKGWLPQVSATAQASLQSDVTAFPEQMQQMYRQMGLDMEGLRRDQYRVGLDVQQTVYDGGAISSRREVTRRQGDVEAAQTEAALYAVRQRVDEMYFSLLLLGEQIGLNADLEQLLAANEQKLQSMYQHGTAAESDLAAVKAELLAARQQGVSLAAQQRTLQRLLSTFCCLAVDHPVKPQPPCRPAAAEDPCARPELRAIDARLLLTDAQERALQSALMPRLSLFAQGFYGYPGYNMFEDMMHRRWSLGGMVGARLTWNIGALYTHRGDLAKLTTERLRLDVERSTFLFNNQLERQQHGDDLERYRQLMADDDEIIALRSKVRQAAESKLSHGIIDASALVKEINQENAARQQRSIHEIEWLKQAYALDYTLNTKK